MHSAVSSERAIEILITRECTLKTFTTCMYVSGFKILTNVRDETEEIDHSVDFKDSPICVKTNHKDTV